MRSLSRPDAEQDAQHLNAGRPLRMLGVQAAAALFHRGEMEGSGISDGLDVGVRRKIGIRPGNRGPLPGAQIRNCLWKGEVRS